MNRPYLNVGCSPNHAFRSIYCLIQHIYQYELGVAMKWVQGSGPSSPQIQAYTVLSLEIIGILKYLRKRFGRK